MRINENLLSPLKIVTMTIFDKKKINGISLKPLKQEVDNESYLFVWGIFIQRNVEFDERASIDQRKSLHIRKSTFDIFMEHGNPGPSKF